MSTPFNLETICRLFNLNGEFIEYKRNTNGHINSTFILSFKEDNEIKKYVLQKISTEIFKNPEGLMNNIVGVTKHIRKKNDDMNTPWADRCTLTFLPTTDGKYFYLDEGNSCWRVYEFIDNVYTCNAIENSNDFYNAGVAFGEFQNLLADYDSSTLVETIPNFHNTVSRFADFKKAVDDNKSGRLHNVKDEVEFALAREKDAHVLVDLIAEGKLPLRVTHNDTKLNNVMIDNKTGKGICVIDLDTVMPGLAMNDFGDTIRFGASTAAEDEKDLSKVSCDMDLYDIYAKGFMEGCGGKLTQREIELMPMGAKVMTYECGMRFLTDYLQGDVYFKIQREEHNLDRARTQFKLVADMEDKWEIMTEIIKKYM